MISSQLIHEFIYICVFIYLFIYLFLTQDISYHISFFWCLGDKQTYLKKILPSLTCSLNKYLAENVEDTYIHVKEIQCKIGNKCYSFGLK